MVAANRSIRRRISEPVRRACFAGRSRLRFRLPCRSTRCRHPTPLPLRPIMTGVIENGAVYPSLKDRSVFITGGGSGIGESLVEHFCAQGSRVAFVDIAEEPSRRLAESIRAKGDPAPHFIP